MDTPASGNNEDTLPNRSGWINHAAQFSRYVKHLLGANEANRGFLEKHVTEPFTAESMAARLLGQPINNEAELHKALRQLRQQVMLRLITRDLNGLADLPEVIETASSLAEITINFAQQHHSLWLEAQYGQPMGHESREAQQLLVIAMGKLGGRELNVSSDVDLIFAYPEDGETNGSKVLSNAEFFDKLGRKLIAALNELTADGFVFRVDMRLRPYGDSGPLTVSFAMLEEYFVAQGREWERYAWIKARSLSGESKALEQLVRPFVFRKYLDFGAYGSMRELHSQIRREVQRREMNNNIKLGPGGIREIEFIAQVFQLIRGGRDASLRIRPTLAVLEYLQQRQLLPTEAVSELSDAYRFLRNLEHRLQYLDDQQTQTLPENTDDQAAIAISMGSADWPAFMQQLDLHRARVTCHFEQVFAAPQSNNEQHGLTDLWQPNTVAVLNIEKFSSLGYSKPQEIFEWLQKIRSSNRYTQLPADNQIRFDTLIPPLIEAAAQFPNADETLERLLNLLETISRRGAYLALLVEHPQALSRVAQLASASAWAAEYLRQHPILLDEFLDSRILFSPPDWQAARVAVEKELDFADGDTERQMDILRHFKHSHNFRLLAQDLAGLLPLETLSDHLSDLACVVLQQTLQLCWKQLRLKHADIHHFAIVAYGKLGGKELGYASDLDLIFLYDDASPDAAEVYARLAQRMNTWLSSVTPAGILYETDLRLRPNGASGLLVSSVEAFREYQQNHAWVWEHQALTRARFVTGDHAVGEQFDAIRCQVLQQTRNAAELCVEVVKMRGKILDAHVNRSTLFDLKHDRGGIIDVEFIVQYLVLLHAEKYPDLTRNIGNIALLKLAAELDLIPSDLAEQTRAGYREYRRLQHQLRLSSVQYARVEPALVAESVTATLALWDVVFADQQS